MEASVVLSSKIPSFQPDPEVIKRRLLKKGVFPTPKIIRTLQKKEALKNVRRAKQLDPPNPLSDSKKQDMEHEAFFQTARAEYRMVMRAFKSGNGDPMVGMPWEGIKGLELRQLASVSKECGGDKLKGESLIELKEMIAERKREGLQWLLDEDLEEGSFGKEEESQRGKRFPSKRQIGDEDRIRMLVDRLCAGKISMHDWKFSRLMKQSEIQFTERHLLRIVQELGARGHWRHALSVVEWVYNERDYKHYRSRFVYTKLLAVLGKARRPIEALHIFNKMREDRHIYPDMPAYHSIAVTLGQAGLVKELLNIIDGMRQKPSKKIKNIRRNWDPCLEPDLVIFNAVLNACVSSNQWKGVAWVLGQMRRNGLKPNEATYGLAMEVMMEAGKYDLVHKFFWKMKTSGLAPKALTYKVLVRTFWKEGKVDEAVVAVKDMEERGVVGTAAVYYELACCLCYNGRWQEAMMLVEKLKTLPLAKPLEVAFTGMIKSCMNGGHVYDCISIFESMNDHCTPNTGTMNAMLKVYGRNDLFSKAKELFEETKEKDLVYKDHYDTGTSTSLTPDVYSYILMLEASASAEQWEYFDYVYKEMVLSGFQLDQIKHGWLLVEASRAGKWHLLEHAFDTILEAGDIPCLSLFTEMICQNIVRYDYERAMTLINSMAHTSLQVSEKQWTELFVRNQDRIATDILLKLLDVLSKGNVMSESVVSNLIRSLQHLCRSLKDSEVIAIGDGALEESDCCGNHEDVNGTTKGRMQQCSTDMASGDCNLTRKMPEEEEEEDDFFKSEFFSIYHTYLSGLDKDEDDDDDQSNDNITEMSLDLLECQDDDSDGSELPSASEILEAWRESQNKNITRIDSRDSKNLI